MRKRSLRVSDDMFWPKSSSSDRDMKDSLKPSFRIKSAFKNFKDKHSKAEFKRRAKVLCSNSSVNCYSYLVDETLQTWERWMWSLVHISAATFAGYVLYVVIDWALAAGTVTTSSPIGIPLNTVPHPALALCNLNKIDIVKADAFADEILAKGKTKYSKEELLNLIWFLGISHDFQKPISVEMQILHEILTPYNLDEVMKRLAPSCEDMLIKCVLRGNSINCSNIFKIRRTSEGYCCTFNYRRVNDFSVSNVSKTLPYLGFLTGSPSMERGLSILVDPQVDRYMYTELPSLGFKVLVFNPVDYADVGSGTCVERLLPPGTELYMTLDVITVRATPDLESLPQETRGCLASFERTIYYDTYSDCLVSCRLQSIRLSCGCIPYTLPPMNESDVCDIISYDCLYRWKNRWFNAWSLTSEPLESDDKREEMETPCRFCIPDCSDNRYKVQQTAILLQQESLNSVNDSQKIQLKQGVVFKNHSILNIYFSKDTVFSLKHDIVYSWYDWLSSLGGICGLVLGCSLLSIVEAVYFLLFGGPPSFRRKIPSHKERMRRLYWKELGANM